MTYAPAERLITVEEFYRLPDPPHGGKMELVRGRVVTHMPVSGGHGLRAVNITVPIADFVRRNKLGSLLVEAGFLLATGPDVVRAPDISFVSTEMLPPGGIPDEGWVPCIPSLAIEIISPSESYDDIQDKLDDYREAGVPRVWLVRARRQSVTVYTDGTLVQVFRSGDFLASSEAGFAVVGFSFAVDDMVSLPA